MTFPRWSMFRSVPAPWSAALVLLWLGSAGWSSAQAAPPAAAPQSQGLEAVAEEWPRIAPLLQRYCHDCHNAQVAEAELDLSAFRTFDAIRQRPAAWQKVREMLDSGQMPPVDAPQPAEGERTQLRRWVRSYLTIEAQAHAGDPGRVVLRRLNNAEYTYTLRDLTGVATLSPAREFPADAAAGEGFTNTGHALVMSPALVTKYLDAAKEVAAHAVLLPDGFVFSPSTARRDWTEERLQAIRAFYGEFTENGGGTAVNLQGIAFDTRDGGVLPLVRYLTATLEEREALRGGQKSVAEVAEARGLNARYLATFWETLNDARPSLVLDQVRAHWREAAPTDAPAVAATIARWQRALWRFSTVGHIGKVGGPAAWQLPASPLANAQPIQFKLSPPADGGELTLYLATSDAGDGPKGDIALWENLRLVTPGRPDLPLRQVRGAVAALADYRRKMAHQAAACLAAAAETEQAQDPVAIAKKHGVEPDSLTPWLTYLGIAGGQVKIESHLKQKLERAENYDFIKGWHGADALSVLANSSDQTVRIPGLMRPHSVAVHPAPKVRVLIGWRSPAAATVLVRGVVQHAHAGCGNGIAWWLELRSGFSRRRLAAGTSQGDKEMAFGPIERLTIKPGEMLALVVAPRDGNHACDLTAVDFTVADGKQEWNLAQEVSPRILDGNPLADRQGNEGVWHFFSEPDDSANTATVIPAQSLLDRWLSTAVPQERAALAAQVQKLLLEGPGPLPADAPDAQLYRQVMALNGPLLSAARDTLLKNAAAQNLPGESGVDPALFGRHPDGATAVDANQLCVQAPAVIEVRLPADLAAGSELLGTGRLHPASGGAGSVQFQVLTEKPTAVGLTAGEVREAGSKGAWTDGLQPVASTSPIIVHDNGPARERITAALHEFRQVFPAALCYTKIVPVDEVVTLTLHYREDEQLRRLLLDDAQAARLDRLWEELHFISGDAVTLVDALEQLIQYATQDADPKVFEPLREPFAQRAAQYRQRLIDSEPAQVDALLRFADRAYRRPLSSGEGAQIRELYARLRQQELPHDEAFRLTLARILVSPAFLYRLEQPGPGLRQRPVSDAELASRLSYFLWSSAPDAELRAVADAGRLHHDDVLLAQMERMLADPKARRLATEFAGQWLHIHDFDQHDEKSERHFPTFAALRGAMYEESILFFTDLLQHNRSLRNVLNADYTFLNEDLAGHYGIPGVTGPAWRRVEGVRQYGRGGILTQATTLSKQAGASRTSPILRGNWISEVLLGERLPRPPKNVPPLAETPPTGLTERQLTEKHSSDPACAKCHARIDPLGFALENFDAIGRYRERDAAGLPIDSQTALQDGTKLAGWQGLREHLLGPRYEHFSRQFYRKLLGYALGRGVRLSDEPLLEEIAAAAQADDERILTALRTIVLSRQFREIRGSDVAAEE